MLNVRSKWKPIIIELKKVNFPVTGINIWPQIFQASNVSETSIVSAFPRLLDMATTFGVRTVVVVVLVVVDVVVTVVVVKVDCDDPQQIWIYMDDKKWDTPHDLGRLPKNDIYNIYIYIYIYIWDTPHDVMETSKILTIYRYRVGIIQSSSFASFICWVYKGV